MEKKFKTLITIITPFCFLVSMTIATQTINSEQSISNIWSEAELPPLQHSLNFYSCFILFHPWDFSFPCWMPLQLIAKVINKTVTKTTKANVLSFVKIVMSKSITVWQPYFIQFMLHTPTGQLIGEQTALWPWTSVYTVLPYTQTFHALKYNFHFWGKLQRIIQRCCFLTKKQAGERTRCCDSKWNTSRRASATQALPEHQDWHVTLSRSRKACTFLFCVISWNSCLYENKERKKWKLRSDGTRTVREFLSEYRKIAVGDELHYNSSKIWVQHTVTIWCDTLLWN